jgi:hypothetical protein
MKITFEENNIPCSQDHSFWKGIPEGISFVVKPFGTGKIKLTAQGYGQLNGRNTGYGNGALYVNWADVTDYVLKRGDL